MLPIGSGHDTNSVRPASAAFSFRYFAAPEIVAAGADPADEGVEPAVGLLPDLRAGGQVMGFRIVHVVVLIGIEAGGGLGRDALGDLHVALGMVVRQIGAGDDDLRAVRLEHVDLLLAHLVRHRAYAAVSAHRRSHRETEAGVARRALDERRAGSEQARLLRPADHVPGHPVLDRARGVVVLELDQHCGHSGVGQPIQLDERSVSDEIEDRLGEFHGRGLSCGDRRGWSRPRDLTQCGFAVPRSPAPSRHPGPCNAPGGGLTILRTGNESRSSSSTMHRRRGACCTASPT